MVIPMLGLGTSRNDKILWNHNNAIAVSEYVVTGVDKEHPVYTINIDGVHVVNSHRTGKTFNGTAPSDKGGEAHGDEIVRITGGAVDDCAHTAGSSHCGSGNLTKLTAVSVSLYVRDINAAPAHAGHQAKTNIVHFGVGAGGSAAAACESGTGYFAVYFSALQGAYTRLQ